MNHLRLTRRTFLAVSGTAALLGCTRSRATEAKAGFHLEETKDGRLRVLDAGAPVLAYNFGGQLAGGAPERYRRACYCHPLYAPDGTVLTDDFPKDHYHHRGVFWAWPRMKARGKAVQTWHLQGIHQKHAAWHQRTADPGLAVLDVTNEWLLDGGERVGRERARILVYKASDVGRAIDFHLTVEAVGEPVELLGAKGKGYGGFCFRFAPRKGTVLTTDEGIQKKDSNDLTPAWADLSARFGGKKTMAGAAIFVHPALRPKPRGWTLRHYGFLGPSWPHLEPYTLEPGEAVTLAYRVYLHRGDADEGKVAEAHARYVRSAGEES